LLKLISSGFIFSCCEKQRKGSMSNKSFNFFISEEVLVANTYKIKAYHFKSKT
jgi:hypothetical protein